MNIRHRVWADAAVLLAAAPVGAEPAATVAVHWEGAIHAAADDFAVAVDLAADDAGMLLGTFSNAARHIDGLALALTRVANGG
jgi:hypothetical protein